MKQGKNVDTGYTYYYYLHYCNVFTLPLPFFLQNLPSNGEDLNPLCLLQSID